VFPPFRKYLHGVSIVMMLPSLLSDIYHSACSSK
jgi:hypothetical protein